MNGLHPIKMPSAKEKVAAELRKAILSASCRKGEAVTLESVANQLEVSVMPVREAFQILARDGLIKLQRNKGAVVLGINETYIREHYQLRAILESAAAEMCCAPEVDITRIEESYECAAESPFRTTTSRRTRIRTVNSTVRSGVRRVIAVWKI